MIPNERICNGLQQWCNIVILKEVVLTRKHEKMQFFIFWRAAILAAILSLLKIYHRLWCQTTANCVLYNNGVIFGYWKMSPSASKLQKNEICGGHLGKWPPFSRYQFPALAPLPKNFVVTYTTIINTGPNFNMNGNSQHWIHTY